eukprot:TRINITY_DN462_c0_g1_i1.p1 TRINITY_DN462_c0_g1~~TRINITY_DN462_c0_g1_i1.p1  ORF type:complete len:160 (-),score=21.68 TRINITY_DN462_c0_g1_i1:74-553(-)
MTDIQTERAFQRQDAISLVNRRLIKKKKKSSGKVRYYKDIGLGYKTPRTAIEGTYIDKKCPFTGNVSIRGTILKGVVVSTKMTRTIIIRRDYLHYIRKYNRFEKRHNNIAAHASPAFKIKEGDVVTVGCCRPLCKTVRFNVIAHEPSPEGTNKKAFRVF